MTSDAFLLVMFFALLAWLFIPRRSK